MNKKSPERTRETPVAHWRHNGGNRRHRDFNRQGFFGLISFKRGFVVRRFRASSRNARGGLGCFSRIALALLALSLSTSGSDAQTWTWPPPPKVPLPTLPDGRILIEVLGVKLAFDPRMTVPSGSPSFTSYHRPKEHSEPEEHRFRLNDMMDNPAEARRFLQSADEFDLYFYGVIASNQIYLNENVADRENVTGPHISVNIRNTEKLGPHRILERYAGIEHFAVCCDLSKYASPIDNPWVKMKPDDDGFYVFSSGSLSIHGNFRNNLYINRRDHEQSKLHDATIFYCGIAAQPGYCYFEYRYSPNVTVTVLDETGNVLDENAPSKPNWLNREARIRTLINSLIVTE